MVFELFKRKRHHQSVRNFCLKKRERPNEIDTEKPKANREKRCMRRQRETMLYYDEELLAVVV